LESVAILPQLLMLSRTSKNESIISHYLLALGFYKEFYLLNWIYRYNEYDFFDPIVVVAGIVETIITFCGYFSIFIKPKVYLVLIFMRLFIPQFKICIPLNFFFQDVCALFLS